MGSDTTNIHKGKSISRDSIVDGVPYDFIVRGRPNRLLRSELQVAASFSVLPYLGRGLRMPDRGLRWYKTRQIDGIHMHTQPRTHNHRRRHRSSLTPIESASLPLFPLPSLPLSMSTAAISSTDWIPIRPKTNARLAVSIAAFYGMYMLPPSTLTCFHRAAGLVASVSGLSGEYGTPILFQRILTLFMSFQPYLMLCTSVHPIDALIRFPKSFNWSAWPLPPSLGKFGGFIFFHDVLTFWCVCSRHYHIIYSSVHVRVHPLIRVVAEVLRLEYVLSRGFGVQVRARTISMVHPGRFSAVRHARHFRRPLEATGPLYAPSRTSSTHICACTIIAACAALIQCLRDIRLTSRGTCMVVQHICWTPRVVHVAHRVFRLATRTPCLLPLEPQSVCVSTSSFMFALH